MSSDLVIKIPSGSSEARVVLVDNKGMEKYKTVAIDELVSSLTSSFKFTTGLLPAGTKFFSGTISDYSIGIESASRVRRFLQSSYATRGKMPKKLEIPFPPCLFYFVIKGNKIQTSKVYGLKSSIIKETDTLCRFPFGNTYEDGKVCWGQNSLSKIDSPQSLTSIVALFFDAPFNGDLFDGRTMNPPKDKKDLYDFWGLLQYLNGKDSFPPNMLVDLNSQVGRLMRTNG